MLKGFSTLKADTYLPKNILRKTLFGIGTYLKFATNIAKVSLYNVFICLLDFYD